MPGAVILRPMRTIFGGALVVLASLLAFGCSSESGDTGPGSGSDRKKPTGCVGKCDSPTDLFVSPYVADVAKMNAIWPGEPAIVKVEDAYTVLVDLGQAKFPAPTHLFGAPVNVIPYSNEDGIKDAAGKAVLRGDAGIAKAFPRGVVGYAIKHHRPEHRKLSPQDIAANMKEPVKCQDIHIELEVADLQHGQYRTVTPNHCQNYKADQL